MDYIKKYAFYLLDLRMGCFEAMAREGHNIADEDIEFYNELYKNNKEKIDKIVEESYAEIFNE